MLPKSSEMTKKNDTILFFAVAFSQLMGQSSHCHEVSDSSAVYFVSQILRLIQFHQQRHMTYPEINSSPISASITQDRPGKYYFHPLPSLAPHAFRIF